MRNHFRHRRHALTGKLIMLFAISSVIIVALVGVSIRHGFKGHFRDVLRPHLERYLEYVLQDIGMPPDRERARLLARQLNMEVYISDDRGDWSSSGRTLNPADLRPERHFSQNGIDYELASRDGRHYLIGRRGDTTLIFGLHLARDEGGGWRALLPLAVLALFLLMLYHLTSRLFAPIDTIEAGVRRFAGGDLQHRISVHRRDELGALAASFNAMADDIQRMLDAKRQLLLAISHELRSPLTRAKIAVDLLDEAPRRQQIQRDLDEIDTLLNELLESERLATRHEVLHKTLCDLPALAREVAAAHGGERIRLDLPVDGLPPLPLDENRIKLLLRNLLDNALRHTPAGADAPTLKISREQDKVRLQVIDRGAGIAAEHLPHVTEPFYRADAARQRATGGYGLGLYLCRMIAEAHGGSLQLSSTPGQGTTVSLILPAAGAAAH